MNPGENPGMTNEQIIAMQQAHGALKSIDQVRTNVIGCLEVGRFAHAALMLAAGVTVLDALGQLLIGVADKEEILEVSAECRNLVEKAFQL